MYDYRWFESVEVPLPTRFPRAEWVTGIDEWAQGAERLPGISPEGAEQWLDSIRRVPRKTFTCPRVFVSHRQADKCCALRIAWLAWEEGFDYWLDIIDLAPALDKQIEAIEQQQGYPITEFQKSVLTAAIIEMALLNCTHVLATMTDKTKGSMWVPYEYGRIKEKLLICVQASCWWDSSSPSKVALPEYLHLGTIHGKEDDIRTWMRHEKIKYPGCPGGRRGTQPTAKEPDKLPTDRPADLT
jgi:hypothetical protein